MAEGKLRVNIVTPAGEKFNGEVDELTAPGFLGEFGVLPGHLEYFTKNPPGVMSVFENGKASHWSVGKGFIEVSDDHVYLLVQSAERAEDIDLERAKDSLSRAEAKLAELDGDLSNPVYQNKQLRIKRAEARIAAASTKTMH